MSPLYAQKGNYERPAALSKMCADLGIALLSRSTTLSLVTADLRYEQMI